MSSRSLSEIRTCRQRPGRWIAGKGPDQHRSGPPRQCQANDRSCQREQAAFARLQIGRLLFQKLMDAQSGFLGLRAVLQTRATRMFRWSVRRDGDAVVIQNIGMW